MPEKPKADALIFATKGGGMLWNWDRQTKASQAESGTADWTRHDLRRTGREAGRFSLPGAAASSETAGNGAGLDV